MSTKYQINYTKGTTYIYSNLGLGDHVVCNGLVRRLIDSQSPYTMFVKPHNMCSVAFMYKDLENLSFTECDDHTARHFLRKHKIDKHNTIIAISTPLSVSFFSRLFDCMRRKFYLVLPHKKAAKLLEKQDVMHFDELFYAQNNLPFSDRWDHFYVARDLSAEFNLFKRFGLKENEYVFVHDDHSRGYLIQESHIINKTLPIIRPVPGLTNNAFDYCYLMANSKESHFIDSSFRLIFDSLKLRNTNIFYHVNARDNVKKDPTTLSNSLLDFTVVR